ncbi:MAG: LysM peptidoglycan-binding domain-containing protein [Rhodothermales bacterium]|nr:LysM peptidoglycan-binding domain-containing protein [Rhodothermales bacterium]
MMNKKALSVTLLVAFVSILAIVPTIRPALGQNNGQPPVEYVVRSGDTLFNIARRFDITVGMLKEANALSGDQIRVGQVLTIPSRTEPLARPDTTGDGYVPTDPPAPAGVEAPVDGAPRSLPSETPAARVDSVTVMFDPVADSAEVAQVDRMADGPGAQLGLLTVQQGQSLYDIALATGLSVDSLLLLNPWVATFLPEGAKLGVPVEYASATYTVKRGDTLFKIARETGTTVGAIRTANQLAGDVIHVGQVLVVPSTKVSSGSSGFATLPVVGSGEARVYSERFVGRLMAAGRPYNPDDFTISHSDLPIGSIVLLSSPETDQQTFAEVMDRLPTSAGYLIDVSRAVSRVFETFTGGNLQVELRVVRYGPSVH